MAEQKTFWVAADGTQFKTQAEALAWEMRKSVSALWQALDSYRIDAEGNLDAESINGLVAAFQKNAAVSTETLSTTIAAGVASVTNN